MKYLFLFLFILVLSALVCFNPTKKKSKILKKQLCNSVLNQNQFRQGAQVGMLDLVVNPNPAVFTCRLYNASATLEMAPGQGMKLIDRGASDSVGPPIVDERAADGDAIFGVKIFSTKENDDVAGDIIEVAGQGAVIWMEASEAIARGAILALVEAAAGEVAIQSTEEVLGIALDKAAADGDLLRVLITARGFAELAFYEMST